MYSDLLSQPYEQDEDLIEQFSEYTVSDLRSNLLEQMQINVVYSYCESQIIEEPDCSEEEIAQIIDRCRSKNKNLLYSDLPFQVLLKLKRVKNELEDCNYTRTDMISLILNLIVENTLLYSSLARFAY